jgi:hypothetical protein
MKICLFTSLAGISIVPGALAILNIECSGLPIPLGVARFPMGQRRLKHVSEILEIKSSVPVLFLLLSALFVYNSWPSETAFS